MLLPFAEQYIVMLEEESSSRLIPIWIGLAEGNAIAVRLNEEKLPRPCSHDLMANILQTLDCEVLRVVITDLRENTYYATLVLEKDGETFEIDSRPSDALALAIRADGGIFIEDRVMEKCPVIKKPISENEVENFRTRLEAMNPEDFFKELESFNPSDE